MALGPIFIILALFRATRGLFEGWIKAATMLALTPVLAVLLGGATLVMIGPMIASLLTNPLKLGETRTLETTLKARSGEPVTFQITAFPVLRHNTAASLVTFGRDS